MALKELAGKSTGRRPVGKTDYQARGVLYLPEASRFSKLLNLPEGADIGKVINEAMRVSKMILASLSGCQSPIMPTISGSRYFTAP